MFNIYYVGHLISQVVCMLTQKAKANGKLIRCIFKFSPDGGARGKDRIHSATNMNASASTHCVITPNKKGAQLYPRSQHALTLRGFSLRYGGSPSTISIAIIPRDQMSTLGP